MPTTHHLGFEIAEQRFRLVEVRVHDGHLTLLRADEYETEYNFGSHLLHDAPFNETLAKSFLKDLTQFFRRQHIFASSVSIALTSHVPFISTVPIDIRLSDEEKREHLRWECALHSDISRRGNINLFTFLLRENCDAHTYLFVSIPQQTIEFLKTSFSLITLKMNAVDIDHFMVERAVQQLERQHAFALIGIHEHYFTLSLCEKDTYIGYRTGKLSASEYHIAPILRSLQELLHTNTEHTLDIVYVYGSACDNALVFSLRSLLHIMVKEFNPLAAVTFENNAEAERALTFPSTTFCAPLGAALQQE